MLWLMAGTTRSYAAASERQRRSSDRPPARQPVFGGNDATARNSQQVALLREFVPAGIPPANWADWQR